MPIAKECTLIIILIITFFCSYTEEPQKVEDMNNFFLVSPPNIIKQLWWGKKISTSFSPPDITADMLQFYKMVTQKLARTYSMKSVIGSFLRHWFRSTAVAKQTFFWKDYLISFTHEQHFLNYHLMKVSWMLQFTPDYPRPTWPRDLSSCQMPQKNLNAISIPKNGPLSLSVLCTFCQRGFCERHSCVEVTLPLSV